MTDDKFTKGDLIEFDGKRYVFRYYEPGGTYLRVGPATKSGKDDRRYDGQTLPRAECKLIKAVAGGSHD